MSTGNHLRSPGLDAVRTLGALLVFCFHATGEWVPFGWAGVQFFFVLSGYLITGRLLALADEELPFCLALGNFIWKRSIRIFPVYFAFLATMTVAVWASGQREMLLQLPYAWTYTYDFFHASNQYVQNRFIAHTWSLAAEEQFYLVYPFVVLGLSRAQLRKTIVAVLLAGPFLRAAYSLLIDSHPAAFTERSTSVYVVGFTHIDAFATGAACQFLGDDVRARLGRRTTLGAFLAFMVALGFLAGGIRGAEYAAFLSRAGWQEAWGYSMVNILAAIVLCVCMQDPSRLFGPAAKGMARFGVYTYGFYLFHFPLLSIFDRVAGKPIGTVPLVLRFASVLLTTALLSIVSFRYFESRFLELKEYRPAFLVRRAV